MKKAAIAAAVAANLPIPAPAGLSGHLVARDAARLAGSTFTRRMELDRENIDAESMVIPASLSSESPFTRWFGKEILSHDASAIDMTLAGRDIGLPLHDNHTGTGRGDFRVGQLVGRVKNIRLEGRRLVGDLHFSPHTEAGRTAFAEARDGFRTDISVGYEILEATKTSGDPMEFSENDEITLTRWKPVEVSMPTVAADNSIGIGRAAEHPEELAPSQLVVAQAAGIIPTGAVMTREGGEGAGTGEPPPLTLAAVRGAQLQARGDGHQAGIDAEHERVTGIMRSYQLHIAREGAAALQQACIEDSRVTVTRAGELLLELLAGDPQPVQQPAQQTEGQHGRAGEGVITRDASDKWIEGVTNALMVRGGLVEDPEKRRAARQNEFMALSLGDLARDYLVRSNAQISGLSRQDLAGLAFTRAGQHGTSDFANVLENVANKAILIGYDEAPETWQQWTRTGNLSDFKVASRVNISSFSDLEQVLESDEYKEGHLSDLKETIQLGKYGKLFHISREAIINDDMDALARIPRAMGRAAARVPGDLAYAILTGNPTLNQDSTTLFHANHANLGTGGVITETTLDEFGKLMAAQTSPAPAAGETGATLNISPKFLLIPRALLLKARKTIDSPTAPDTTGDLTVNTQRNAWTIVWDARLDADSLVEYYAAADPNLIDTVEVAFLDGIETPYMESRDGFTIDGVSYKVRLECAAAAMDFRGMAYNAGA